MGLRTEVEGLVEDPRRFELVRLAAVPHGAEAAEERFERARPVLLGGQEEPDQVAPRHVRRSLGCCRPREEGCMVDEARLVPTETGLVPQGDGWYVVNARETRW